MTDQAIANGINLRPLSKKETVAAMALTLAENYMGQGQYERVIDVADLVLEYDPKSVDAMLHKGSACARLIRERFQKKYPTPNLIPPKERLLFQYLAQNNQYWFQRAEALGWRDHPGRRCEVPANDKAAPTTENAITWRRKSKCPDAELS